MVLQEKALRKYNLNCLQISDFPYIIIIRGYESGKTNALLNLIRHQRDIDKIYTLRMHIKQNRNI